MIYIIFIKLMKIHHIASDEEKYSTKETKMNIALRYSLTEDYVSVIVFKSIFKEILFQFYEKT